MKTNYFIIPILVFLVSIIGGMITSGGMDWYKTINLPSFTPDGSIIGTVWTIIFILFAISAIIFWNKYPKNKTFDLITMTFVVNGILNVLWSYLFFGKGLIFLAFIEALLLEISVLILIISLWKKVRASAYLLLPYAGWVIFASYLTYIIWLLN